MVELTKFERRVVVLALAVMLAAVFVRWRQAESSKVSLQVLSEGSSVVQR